MVLLFVVTQCTLDKNLIFQETQTVRTLLKKKKNPTEVSAFPGSFNCKYCIK